MHSIKTIVIDLSLYSAGALLANCEEFLNGSLCDELALLNDAAQAHAHAASPLTKRKLLPGYSADIGGGSTCTRPSAGIQ